MSLLFRLFHMIAWALTSNSPRKRFTATSALVEFLDDRQLLSGVTPLAAEDIGIFRHGQWLFDREGDGYSGENQSIAFGLPGDIAITADVVGNDGREEIGIFRNGTWVIDVNHNGYDGSDWVLQFGLPGDIPVTGNVDGLPGDEIGVFRNGNWYFDWNHNGYDASDLSRMFQFGLPGDTPILANLDGSGDRLDELAVFRNGQIFIDWNHNGYDASDLSRIWQFGLRGDRILAGDLNGDGWDEICAYRAGSWYVDWNHNGYDIEYRADWQFGLSGDQPVISTFYDTAPISFELRDAPLASTEQKRVLLWLEQHSHLIVQAEARFQIDRRAIAGVIAFEALNPANRRPEPWPVGSTYLDPRRGSPGPGKVHYKNGYLYEGNPISKQIEGTSAFGQYISPKTMVERLQYCSTVPGAIEYIGGIMNAYAVVLERVGFEGLRWHPEILGNLYQGSALWSQSGENLVEFERLLRGVFPSPRSFNPESDLAGGWIRDHFQWIESIVGVPNRPVLEEIVGAVGSERFVVEEIPNAGLIVHYNSETPSKKAVKYVPHPTRTVKIFAGGGDDVVINKSTLPLHVYGGDGNDNIDGGEGNDQLWGGSGNDRINGHSGDNRIYGEDGDDVLFAWYG